MYRNTNVDDDKTKNSIRVIFPKHVCRDVMNKNFKKIITCIYFQDTRTRGFLYYERVILTPLSTYEALLTLQYPYMYDPPYAPTPFLMSFFIPSYRLTFGLYYSFRPHWKLGQERFPVRPKVNNTNQNTMWQQVWQNKDPSLITSNEKSTNGV